MTASPIPLINPAPEKLQEIIGRIEIFSPAPRILARAIVLVQDERCSLDSIAALIRGDPALSADMLRIANSAWFGTGLQVESVEHALQRIGLTETMRLLNLSVSRSATHTNLDNYCLSAEDYWAESLFHGLFMEQLAKATAGATPGEAYTAGLLRYIGRLAINRAIQEMGTGLFWLGPEPLDVWERKRVGFTHSQAGALLLQRWNFPTNLVEGCAGQENPALLSEPNWLASALHFITLSVPTDLDQPFNPVLGSVANSDFLEPNGLTPESVVALFAKTRVTYLKVRQNFGSPGRS